MCKTEDGGTYDPTAPGAPLTIYATGIRSGFDLLWHRNGNLYTGLNGAAAGGNVPQGPNSHRDHGHQGDDRRPAAEGRQRRILRTSESCARRISC